MNSDNDPWIKWIQGFLYMEKAHKFKSFLKRQIIPIASCVQREKKFQVTGPSTFYFSLKRNYFTLFFRQRVLRLCCVWKHDFFKGWKSGLPASWVSETQARQQQYLNNRKAMVFISATAQFAMISWRACWHIGSRILKVIQLSACFNAIQLNTH